MSRDRETTTLEELIGKKIITRRESDDASDVVDDQMGIMSMYNRRTSSSSSTPFGVPHPHHQGGLMLMNTTTLNTITPCAACKLLRRRCAEECPFSPYFSPHEPQKFAAVHKVFGASNVSKMLLEVPESQRADAANSIVYEANLRIRDPVYGCVGVISALQQQMQSVQAELNAVRTEILRYRYKEAASGHNNIHHAALVSNSAGMVSINAARPQTISPPPPPPPPTLSAPPTSVVFSSSSSSSASSLYNPSTNTAGYSSMSSDNVPYFD